jgi:hypothetical protein
MDTWQGVEKGKDVADTLHAVSTSCGKMVSFLYIASYLCLPLPLDGERGPGEGG